MLTAKITAEKEGFVKQMNFPNEAAVDRPNQATIARQ